MSLERVTFSYLFLQFEKRFKDGSFLFIGIIEEKRKKR